jgi:hypothetical protein
MNKMVDIATRLKFEENPRGDANNCECCHMDYSFACRQPEEIRKICQSGSAGFFTLVSVNVVSRDINLPYR